MQGVAKLERQDGEVNVLGERTGSKREKAGAWRQRTVLTAPPQPKQRHRSLNSATAAADTSCAHGGIDQVGTQCELTRQDLAVISTRDVERREANWRASIASQVSLNSISRFRFPFIVWIRMDKWCQFIIYQAVREATRTSAAPEVARAICFFQLDPTPGPSTFSTNPSRSTHTTARITPFY